MEQFQLEKNDIREKLLAHLRNTENPLAMLAVGCHKNK